MMIRRASIGLAFAAGVLVMTFPGCAASDGRVAGVVTVAGQPAGGGTISFVAPTGSAFTARIEADGSYELRGVPPGEMIVLVFNPPPQDRSVRNDPLAKQKKAAGQHQPEPQRTGPPIPARYSQPATSPVCVSVIPGSNRLPIDLKP